MNTKDEFFIAIDKLHTTKLGEERIRKNLNLSENTGPVEYLKGLIRAGGEISRVGKNFYFSAESVLITINAGSSTIITAHRKK